MFIYSFKYNYIMIVEIKTDFDNSTNRKKRYMVSSDGYVKKKNLTMTEAKKIKSMLVKAIHIKQKLKDQKIYSLRTPKKINGKYL